jgi:hypothetical protein
MKLARNLSSPVLANISGRIDIYPLANAARHTSPEDFKHLPSHMVPSNKRFLIHLTAALFSFEQM